MAENIFPHPGLENDWGDDAINLWTDVNILIGPGNVIDFNSFAKYGICDFDGDGVDDCLLCHQHNWWFSGLGDFQWSYLQAAQGNG